MGLADWFLSNQYASGIKFIKPISFQTGRHILVFEISLFSGLLEIAQHLPSELQQQSCQILHTTRIRTGAAANLQLWTPERM